MGVVEIKVIGIGPVVVRLNSGRIMHLDSNERSGDIEDAEVRNNPRIASLVERRIIELEPLEAGGKRKTSERGSSGRRSRGSGPPSDAAASGTDTRGTDTSGTEANAAAVPDIEDAQ